MTQTLLTDDRRHACIRHFKRPVALFIDEAHDLNGHTLTGLKRLIGMVEDGDGRLSVVLAGWPKLKNDLRRPACSLQEIGCRTDVFSLDGITGSQREYIRWLLSTIGAASQAAPYMHARLTSVSATIRTISSLKDLSDAELAALAAEAAPAVIDGDAERVH